MDKGKQYCYIFRRNLCRKICLFIIYFTQSAARAISHPLLRSCTSASLLSAAAIKKLENNLDTTLFKRSSRGVALTPDGRILYEKVKGAFDLLSEGEDSILHNRSREIPRLRIGASTTLCKYVLMPRLKDFIAANPQIRITISCQSTYQTLKLLEEDKIDIGLIGRPQKLSGIRIFASAADPGYLCRYTPIPGESAPAFSIRTPSAHCYFHAS